jgi:streptomycin 6-kinase
VIPELLARNAREAWGADGERWLAALPARLDHLAAAWQLELGAPYALTYHWVCRARTADGTPAVLKTGPDLAREAAALAAWDGSGAVRLLRVAEDALLLERADPGTRAAHLVPDTDEQATAAAVEVLRRLHVAAPPAEGLPTLAEHLTDLDAHLADPARDRLVAHELVGRAAGLARELLAGAPPGAALLHGDLHHDNVLLARDGWLAIDPHGVVGDPGYDAGAWLYNPPELTSDAVPVLVPARVEQLADGLGQPLDRIIAWGFVQAVLSAVWTADTGSRSRMAPQDRTLDVAALLLPRLS